MKSSWTAYSIDSQSILPASLPKNSNGGAREDADIALLNGIAGRMAAVVPPQEMLREVVEFVAALAQCDSCMIYVLEDEHLVLRSSKNPHPEAVDRLKMKVGQGITGWVAQHREPVVVPRGAYLDPRFKLFNELPEDRFEAFLSFPMVSGGRLVGVINLQNRVEYSYSQREIGLIATLAFLVGTELERTRLESQNARLSDQLESRKVIERAKGILQRELRISEEDAYLTLQRESRQRRKSMKEVASAIILSEDLKRSR
jgi:uroporphyrinogen-III synthase